MAAANQRLESALGYAKRGWPVFPLFGVTNGACDCPKGRECKHAGKHPMIKGGFKAATLDEANIRSWWGEQPNANIGIACGPARLFVLDVDTPGGGHGEGNGAASLVDLEAQHGPLPGTAESRTGSGGRHLWFLAPEGVDMRPGAALAPGLDWRTGASYVVAPPSVNAAGPYTWVRTPQEAPIAEVPGWLAALVQAPRQGKPDRANVAQAPLPPQAGGVLAQGQRNNGMASLAGKVRSLGATVDEVEAALLAFNASRCVPPLADDEVRAIAASVGRYPGTEPEDPDVGPDPLPELAPAAFHGSAGELVRLLEPSNEADPAGMLVTALVYLGNILGRGAFVPIGSAPPQRPNLFVALLGSTSAGRKGSGEAATRSFMHKIDLLWTANNAGGGTGLASGEGLVNAVRDAGPAIRRKGKGGKIVTLPGAPGVTDKRALVFEPELVRTLAVGKREGATILPIIREAFDGGTLRVKTRNDPLVATDPHVSILAHATPKELIRKLDVGEVTGGTANRFAWFYVRRAQVLPVPPDPPEQQLEALASRVRSIVSAMRGVGAIRLSHDAELLWCEVYGRLSSPAGPLADFLSRAPVHVLRFALVYALLDGSRSLELPHLEAALALWRYSEASVRRIFGADRGDKLPDMLLALLGKAGPAGVPKSELLRSLRGTTAQKLNDALAELEAANRIGRRDEPTGGRARTVWFLRGDRQEETERREERPAVQQCAASPARKEGGKNGNEARREAPSFPFLPASFPSANEQEGGPGGLLSVPSLTSHGDHTDGRQARGDGADAGEREERAAIMEYEGGLPRDEAERLAGGRNKPEGQRREVEP